MPLNIYLMNLPKHINSFYADEHGSEILLEGLYLTKQVASVVTWCCINEQD